jgi:hypothetical protein
MMRRTALALDLYLARLAGLLNAAARRRWARSLLTVRPYRTPAASPVAILATIGQPCGQRSPKGRNPFA